MFRRSFTQLLSLITLVSLGSVLPTYADTTPPPSTIKTPGDVLNIICNFAVYFFYVVIIITVIMVVYASFLYITAGEDTEKTSKARRTLTYAAVGIAVSLCAVGFPTIIAGIVSSSSVGSLAPHCTILGGSSG